MSSGLGVSAEDLDLFKEAAEGGHAQAQNALGQCYRDGDGVEQNDAEAVRWYRASAAQGFAPAQCNLGTMYRAGRGVDQDHVAATDGGDAMAQDSLGHCSTKGKLPKRTEVEVMRWFRAAAAQEFVIAHELNDVEAVRWFRAAAEQEHAHAQSSLGWMYFAGTVLVFHHGFCCVRVSIIGLRLLCGARFSTEIYTRGCIGSDACLLEALACV
jgi:TPR repeat protein